MQIVTSLERSDAALLALLLALRSPGFYLCALLCGLTPAGAMVWLSGWPLGKEGWMVLATITAVAAAGAWALALVGTVVRRLYIAGQTHGALGVHEFEITSDALTETTATSRSVIAWAGIARIHGVGPYLVFFRSPVAWHVIPKRAFAGFETSAAFEQQAQAYWTYRRITQTVQRPAAPGRIANAG